MIDGYSRGQSGSPRPDDVVGVEVEPTVAAELFGDRLELIRRFTADLARRGVELGLIGPKEPARLWTRHILNCGLLATAIPKVGTVADIGSGAGLPGLVLAIARPDLAVTLIEPMQRRTDWLVEERDRLGISVEVMRARAEDVPKGRRFDVVTARAVGALRTLIPMVAPLVSPGGSLMLMKGAGVDGELTQAESAIRRAGLTDIRVDVVGSGMALEETRILRATVHSSASRMGRETS